MSETSKNKTLVMKFGGSSIGSVDAMTQAVQIICQTQREWPRTVVVTSALAGVTNLLIESATRAARGDMNVFHQAVSELTERHLSLIDSLIKNPSRKHQVHWEVKHLIADFSNLCQAINVLGEASPRALDAVAALGERLSVRILAAAVESAGLPAEYIESTHLVLTDDHFTNACPVEPEPVGFIGGTSSHDIWHHAHKRQIADMIHAIREDREPLVNGEEGRKPLEIVLAVYESSHTGQTIRFA